MTTQAKPKFYFTGIKFNSSYYDTEVDNTITKVEVASQYIKNPINNATGPVNSVLTLTNTTTKETTWTTPATVITNYVNYTPALYELVTNVSGTPSTIVRLTVNESIGRNTAQRFGLPANCSTAPSGSVLSILTASGTAPSTQ